MCFSQESCTNPLQEGDTLTVPDENAANYEGAQEVFNVIPFSDFLLSEDHTLNGYCFMNEIGSGCMSRVFQVVKTDEDDELCAAKVYSNQLIGRPTLSGEDQAYVCIQRELDLMVKLSHQYVISLIEAFNDPITNSLIIIQPFAPFGNVKSLIDHGKLNDDAINCCFHQIAIACAYLHSKNVVHRDIKPENFLSFGDDFFVLTDLSVSQELDSPDSLLADTRGSPAFLSPEEIAGTPFYPKPADVWAYGISLYKCIFGNFPFGIEKCAGMPFVNTIMLISDLLANQNLFIPDNADQLLVDLLSRILDKSPSKRPTFDEIAQDLFFEKSWEIHRRNCEDLVV